MEQLLLVEDDVPLGQALHDVLRAQPYASTWVRTGEAARRFLADESFDILLLDIVLPGESGLDLLRWLRGQHNLVPVMILTARDAITDRVLGLDSGADDYLPKPFAIEELLSRIRSLLRRRTEQRTALWHVGALAIDTARRRVQRNAVPIALSRREYDVLLLLAARPGVVLTRQELARGSNAEDLLDSNAVDVQVHGLRKKLAADVVGTVRGVGYFLESESA